VLHLLLDVVGGDDHYDDDDDDDDDDDEDDDDDDDALEYKKEEEDRRIRRRRRRTGEIKCEICIKMENLNLYFVCHGNLWLLLDVSLGNKTYQMHLCLQCHLLQHIYT
jgi:hypothetical protein